MGNLDTTADNLADPDQTDALDLARIQQLTVRIFNHLTSPAPDGFNYRAGRGLQDAIYRYVRNLFRRNRNNYIATRHHQDIRFPLEFNLADREPHHNLRDQLRRSGGTAEAVIDTEVWIDIRVARDISLYNRGYDDSDDSDHDISDESDTAGHVRDKLARILRELEYRLRRSPTSRYIAAHITRTTNRVQGELADLDDLADNEISRLRLERANRDLDFGEGQAGNDQEEEEIDETENILGDEDQEETNEANEANADEEDNANEDDADDASTVANANETGSNNDSEEQAGDDEDQEQERADNNEEQEQQQQNPPPPLQQPGRPRTMPHWANPNAVVAAVQAYGLVDFRAKAVTPEGTTAEYNMHIHSVLDLYDETNVDGIGAAALQSNDARGRVHALREFKVLARLTWKGAALEYWGSVVLGSHAHILDTHGNDLGPAWPPATMASAQYTHPANQGVGNIRYPGYEDLVRAAQEWAQNRGEDPKYDKIDWKPATYDGSALKLTQWEQTIDAITTARNLPALLPNAYKVRITHAIATQFTGLAAEAWSKEANKPTQIRTQGAEQGIIDWCRAKFLSHAHVQERAHALQTTRWTSGSLTEYNEKHKVLQAEAQQDTAAHALQVEWYLNALPTPLAAKARNSLATAALTARGNGNPYQATLSHVMELAIQLQADFDLQQQRSQNSRKSNQTGNRSESGRPSGNNSNNNNGNKNKNNNGKRPSDTGKKPFTCYKCRQEGHLANNCPNKAVVSDCKSCGEAHEYGKHTNKKQTFIAQLRTEGRRRLPLHCKATVQNHPVNLIVDTGATVDLVSKSFLNKIGKKIQRPTDRIIHTASGVTFRPLGEIDDLPIQIEDQQIPTLVYVDDTDEYDLLVSIQWLKRSQAVLDLVNMDLTIRRDGTLISTNLYDQEKIEEIQQETEDLATEPEPNLKHETVMYTMAMRDPMAAPRQDPLKPPTTHYPRPLTPDDLDAFVAYAWLRVNMGPASTTEDTTGLRCPAGYSFCRDCYREGIMCGEGRNACKYWAKYAGAEPLHWRYAVQRIINNRRSTTSPKYETCPYDWRDVLRDSYAKLHPQLTGDPAAAPDNDPAAVQDNDPAAACDNDPAAVQNYESLEAPEADNGPATAPAEDGPTQLAHPRADEYWDFVRQTNPDAFDPAPPNLPYYTTYVWADEDVPDSPDPWTDDYELKDEHF